MQTLKPKPSFIFGNAKKKIVKRKLITYTKVITYILSVEVKSGPGTVPDEHASICRHTSQITVARDSLFFAGLFNYQSIDSRPLYAACSLAHSNQKEALDILVKED